MAKDRISFSQDEEVQNEDKIQKVIVTEDRRSKEYHWIAQYDSDYRLGKSGKYMGLGKDPMEAVLKLVEVNPNIVYGQFISCEIRRYPGIH